MKANLRLRVATKAVALAAMVLLTSCSERRVPPTPTPTSAPAPPPPAPVPQPDVDWREAPITPGDWTWSLEGGQSVARFANGQLELRCDRAAGAIMLLRAGRAPGNVPMSIDTESVTRPVTGVPRPGNPPALAVTIPARDPLLDAMAFSRGRFAVEAAGLPTLYVPSWTEVTRVIEDCR